MNFLGFASLKILANCATPDVMEFTYSLLR